MWELIGSLILGAAKLWFSIRKGRKLSEKEFVEHVRAHQERRANAAKSARDFDDVVKEVREEMKKEEEEEKQ